MFEIIFTVIVGLVTFFLSLSHMDQRQRIQALEQKLELINSVLTAPPVDNPLPTDKS